MKKINIYTAICLLLLINVLYAQKVLTLEESKQLALQNNVKIKNSSLEIQASEQVKKAAFTNFFPNVSFGGLMFKAEKNMMEIQTQGGNLPVYDGNPANLGSATQFAYFPSSTMGLMKSGTFGYLNIVQPIFAGGRIVNGNRLASLGEDVSDLQNKLAINETNLKTEEQYRFIVSLKEKHKTILKYEEMLNSLLKQVEDAFKSGLIMKNDLLKVKLKFSEVLLNKSKLENGIKLASMAFCQHIGIPYDSLIIYTDNPAINEISQSYYADPSESLKKRYEYGLLEKSVEAEKLQTKMKLGEYLPSAAIGLTGLYMKMDDSKDRTIGMIFGTVSIPISDWWGGSHTLQERKVKEEIAENNFKDNLELIILQINKAWNDFTDAYKQYLLSEEAKAQAEENLKVNEDSYKNGLISVSDLLTAQALMQQSQDQAAEAKANYLVKKTTYLQATGR